MASRSLRSVWMAVFVAAAVAVLVPPRPASAQLQFSSADGKQSFKIGVLGQVQGESIENADLKADSSNNLFLRRIRLLGNFKLSDDLTVFFDTDAPNLGKGNPDGTKNNADLFLQDFVVTYSFSKAFQIDGGMMLLGQTYNHLQSAATLMAVDYGPYTFIESVPTTSRTGRDYGVQARGYLGDDHLEYRGGVFQGVRGVNNTNALRYSGRLAYYILGPQTAYFYRGTSLGKIQTLSIGGSFDRQQDYKSYGADFYWDQPVAGGDGVTVQADYQQLDGDIFIPGLPKQTNTMIEAGYYIHGAHLQPYIQYAQQNFDAVTRPDEKRTQGGLAYYFNGHNSNLKLALTSIDKDGAKKRRQIQLQYQVYAF
jgi:hypothetical protein